MTDINEVLDWLTAHPPRRVAVLTGAGVSAESGIPTFRGNEGLWRNFSAEQLATPEAFARDPSLVWEWYEWRRGLIRDAQPNAAHLSLARLEKRLGNDFTLITQNVDGLHSQAGSLRMLELHGNIFRVRCIDDLSTRDVRGAFDEIPPRCDCGALLRPDVVWFGEPLDVEIMKAATLAVAEADLFLIIGTSGAVYPAAGLISLLRNGVSIEINPQSTSLTSRCDFVLRQSAVAAVPPLVDALLGGGR